MQDKELLMHELGLSAEEAETTLDDVKYAESLGMHDVKPKPKQNARMLYRKELARRFAKALSDPMLSDTPSQHLLYHVQEYMVKQCIDALFGSDDDCNSNEWSQDLVCLLEKVERCERGGC